MDENKKITELPEASGISATDWLVMVDVVEDETKKIHPNLVGASIPVQDTAPQNPEEDDLWIDTSEPEEYNEPLDYYSLSEVKTNKIWIDGKPIYRKVINAGTLPNSTTKQVAHNISNLGKFVNVHGICYTPTNQTYILPWVHTTNTSYQTNVYCDTTYVNLVSGTDRSNVTESYVVLEYTKTTD